MVQTPKQKAAYFVVKYMSKVVHMKLAIECAIVAVEEIISAGKDVDGFSDAFWLDVKKEIEAF